MQLRGKMPAYRGALAFEFRLDIDNHHQHTVWRVSPQVTRWGRKVDRTVAAEHWRMEAERARVQVNLPVQPWLLFGRCEGREACRPLAPALHGVARQATLPAPPATSATHADCGASAQREWSTYRSAPPRGFDRRGRQLDAALDPARGEDVLLVATRHAPLSARAGRQARTQEQQ